jgi:hypothetical protein
VEVKVLGDDEDASFTRVKVFPGEVTGLILGGLGPLYTKNPFIRLSNG